MKRNFWNLVQAAALCVAMTVALPACDDEDEITEGDDDNTENVDPGTDDGTDPSTSGEATTPTENVYVTTDCITPIRYAEGYYVSEGTEDVAITVTSLTTDDIVFTVTPSSEVKSYLVQVYPLASVYNTYLNQMNAEGLSSLTLDECTGYLEQIITLTESEYSGGKLMNEETLGSDYACYEFDWKNSGYMYYTIQQESEYVIVVQACFDTEGENLADLCVVHVTTPTVALQGSPAVTTNIEPGYFSYVCTFVPNSDCYYLYYLVGDYDDIMQFVTAYGESLYRDYIRHYGGRATVGVADLKAYATDLSEQEHMLATAIPLDFNGTPAASVYFEDFYLNERPEGRVAASATMNVVKNSATVAHTRVEMDEYTSCIYYNILDRSAAEGYMGSDDETREAYAENLALYGWGIANPNYGFDRDNNVPTGSSGTYEDYWPRLTPGAEYMLVWVAQNAYGDLTDLCFSDPFTMKQLVTDSPETSKEDVVFTIPTTDRTSITIDFTYTSENTAVYYFQNYAPTYDNETYVFPEAADESARADWLYWLIYYVGDYGDPWPNIWLASDDDDPSTPGHSRFTFYGFDSGTQYEYICVAEDWDGVLGYLKFATGLTKENTGGPDPQIESVSWDPETGEITFHTNDDAHILRYSAVDYSSEHASNVGLPDLLKRDGGDYFRNEYAENWETWLLEYGLYTYTTTGRTTIDLDSNISIALAMAIGTDSDSQPVYSALSSYVYTPSVGLQTFDNYWAGNDVVVDTSSVKSLKKGAYVPARVQQNSSARVRPTSRK